MYRNIALHKRVSDLIFYEVNLRIMLPKIIFILPSLLFAVVSLNGGIKEISRHQGNYPIVSGLKTTFTHRKQYILLLDILLLEILLPESLISLLHVLVKNEHLKN